MKEKDKTESMFVERKQLTLGIKIVTTFAMTYYLLYFLLLTIFVFFHRNVFDPSYLDNTDADSYSFHIAYLLILWGLVATIVVSLFLVFRKKRYGKFMFMIFTMLLVGYQFFTSEPPVWVAYILEILIMGIIAPLKVVKSFQQKIKESLKHENYSGTSENSDSL